jgi:hypothetical protein
VNLVSGLAEPTNATTDEQFELGLCLLDGIALRLGMW